MAYVFDCLVFLSVGIDYKQYTNKGGGEDTTFKAKDSERVRGQDQGPSCQGQVASRPRTERLEAKAKDSKTRLKMRVNINVNIVIMIS